jgi:hypothetical protein
MLAAKQTSSPTARPWLVSSYRPPTVFPVPMDLFAAGFPVLLSTLLPLGLRILLCSLEGYACLGSSSHADTRNPTVSKLHQLNLKRTHNPREHCYTWPT